MWENRCTKLEWSKRNIDINENLDKIEKLSENNAENIKPSLKHLKEMKCKRNDDDRGNRKAYEYKNSTKIISKNKKKSKLKIERKSENPKRIIWEKNVYK